MDKKELVDRLSKALERKDLDRIKEIRQQLLEFEIDDSDFQDFARRVRGRVLLDLQDQTDEPSQIIENAVRSMTQFAQGWITQQLLFSYNRFYETAIRDTMRVSHNPALYAYMVGTPVDRLGVRHSLGVINDTAVPNGSSEEEIFMQISDMIAVEGAPYWEVENHLFQHMFQLSPRLDDFQIMQPNIQVSRGIRTKLEVINNMFRRDATSVEKPEEAMKPALEAYAMRINVELKHEILRVKGLAEQSVIVNLRHVSGYTLRSVFLDGTGTSHGDNDGIVYLKGSPEWGSRLIPPYRKNCKCFQVPKFIEIPAMGFNNPFMIRDKIMIRDMRKFHVWYSGQLIGVQKTLVGEERYDLNPHPTKSLWSLFDREGNLVPLKALRDEDGVSEWAINRHNTSQLRANRFGERYDEVSELIDNNNSRHVELGYFQALRSHLS